MKRENKREKGKGSATRKEVLDLRKDMNSESELHIKVRAGDIYAARCHFVLPEDRFSDDEVVARCLLFVKGLYLEAFIESMGNGGSVDDYLKIRKAL